MIFNKKTFVSIIGIGGEAGRIVNQTQACELPDTELSVFGMNSIGTATMVAEPVHWASSGRAEVNSPSQVTRKACPSVRQEQARFRSVNRRSYAEKEISQLANQGHKNSCLSCRKDTTSRRRSQVFRRK